MINERNFTKQAVHKSQNGHFWKLNMHIILVILRPFYLVLKRSRMRNMIHIKNLKVSQFIKEWIILLEISELKIVWQKSNNIIAITIEIAKLMRCIVFQ